MLVALIGSTAIGHAAPVLEGITFAVEPGKVYVPLDEAGQALRWRVVHDSKGKELRLKATTIPYSNLRSLVDGSLLVRISDLERAGVRVKGDAASMILRVGISRHYFTVTVSAKRAEVNLAQQRLRGWQGTRLVLESRVSSGRKGRTPSGNFRAGPYKARRHYSSRYNNAAMPWSVQVTGHVFIHGFTSVPNYPASHGCIRVPLNEGNPARFFYEWIDKGAPIQVVRK